MKKIILICIFLCAAPLLAQAQTYLSQQSHKQGAENAISITSNAGAQTGIDTIGYSTFVVTISGTYGAINFKVEGSTDGSAYTHTPLPMFRVSDGQKITASGSLTNNIDQFEIDVRGFKKVRVNITAYTSGTAVITQTPIAAQFSPTTIVSQPTAANLNATVTGTLAATQSGTWTVQPGNTANTTAWKVDGSAVTQPISGTVTANAGSGTLAVSLASVPSHAVTNAGTFVVQENGAALTALQLIDNLPLTQGSTTSGQSGLLAQGAVTTSAPAYTTAQTSPFSLTTAGALRVDGSAVTQPVSGTVGITANSAVNVAQVGGTNTVNGGVAGILAVGGNVANAVAATANPVPVGGIFTTTPATLTTGQTATMQFTAAQNLKHDVTTIAGTAPTTAGKLDVKGADGDVFVRQATAANLNATVTQVGATVTTTTLQNAAVANGNGTAIVTVGMATVVMTVNCASCSGGTTINFEGRQDATNYTPLMASMLGTVGTVPVTTTTTSGITYWVINAANMADVRARVSAYSAGTVTITGTASPMPWGVRNVEANLYFGGTAANTGSGNATGALRVELANNGTGVVGLNTGANVIGALTANQSVNLNQIAGSSVSTAATGVQKVGIVGNAGANVDSAPDATAPTNVLNVAGRFVTTPATLTTGQAGSLQLTAAQNLKTDLSTIAGTAAVNGSGTATGALRVELANNSTGVLAGVTTVTTLTTLTGGGVAHDGANSGNPVLIGANATNASITAVANNDRSYLITDLNGKLINLPYTVPENMVSGVTAAITNTTTTDIIAAAGAGVRNYVTSLSVINSHATVGTVMEIRDGATTVIWRGYAGPTGGGFTISFPVPLRGTANTATTCTAITTGANVYCSAAGFKAP